MSEEIVVAEDDLYEVYSMLADATDAAAAGDTNTVASKAADAKEIVLDMHKHAKNAGGKGS